MYYEYSTATRFECHLACRLKAVPGGVAHQIAARLLRAIFSRTTANGILGKGGMFVMSKSQARTLLQRNEKSSSAGVLLDVGAGDGNVTVGTDRTAV